jgi:hypothetical protein
MTDLQIDIRGPSPLDSYGQRRQLVLRTIDELRDVRPAFMQVRMRGLLEHYLALMDKIGEKKWGDYEVR